MKIFALSDPHFSLGTPEKGMEAFGAIWREHHKTIERHWRAAVGPTDLVLVPGDLSWAMRMEGALPDLHFIGALPGIKVVTRGNHDYWWTSKAKVRAALPESMIASDGDAIRVGKVAIAGTRLWDLPDVSFAEIIEWMPNPFGKEKAKPTQVEKEQSLGIYRREVGRLKLALAELEKIAADMDAAMRIAITHYPPCSADLQPNELTALFEAHRIRHVVFGHLHAVSPRRSPAPFGERGGVAYHLASCDYTEFRPVLIDEV